MRGVSSSLFSALVLFVCFSCSSEEGKHKEAMQLLEEAKVLEDQESFAQAIAKVDSAIALAPIDTAVLRQSTSLKRHIYLQEANYKLLSIHQKLDQVEKEIPTLLKGFNVVQNKYYATELRYQHPTFRAMDKQERPYLRVRLDSLGGIHISSVYVGQKAIEHTRVKLQDKKENNNYLSQSIDYDKALNYRYKVGAKHWEVISYGDADSRAMAEFLEHKLCDNSRKELELQYLNKDRVLYKISLNKGLCEGINKSLSLYKLLHRRDSLRQEQGKYARRFVRLNQ